MVVPLGPSPGEGLDGVILPSGNEAEIISQ
jgi:hypothetical protein